MTLRDLIKYSKYGNNSHFSIDLDDDIKIDVDGELQSIEGIEKTKDSVIIVIAASSLKRRFE